PTKPEQDLSHTNRPTAPIIEDWVSDSEDESETKTPQSILSFVQSSKPVGAAVPQFKKNSVLFTDTECLVLSPDFKLPDASQVLLKVPRENNMYNVNLKNIVPSGDLTCLFAKATIDESNLWHRRLGHINFKTINKLVKDNLVRGLPSKFLKMLTPVLLVRKASNIEPLVRPSLSVLLTSPYTGFTWTYLDLPLLKA
nr:ribonuclease H-like domain-containing protein [Tanacetum cinerariifolium]